jgi:hypothetical protein
MDDFPTRIADFLEDTAHKIRAMTVDRVRGVAKWAALGMLLTLIAFLAVLFLFIGLFRILGELIGVETTYAVIGGLFVVGGALLWSQRVPKDTPKATEQDD